MTDENPDDEISRREFLGKRAAPVAATVVGTGTILGLEYKTGWVRKHAKKVLRFGKGDGDNGEHKPPTTDKPPTDDTPTETPPPTEQPGTRYEQVQPFVPSNCYLSEGQVDEINDEILTAYDEIDWNVFIGYLESEDARFSAERDGELRLEIDVYDDAQDTYRTHGYNFPEVCELESSNSVSWDYVGRELE